MRGARRRRPWRWASMQPPRALPYCWTCPLGDPGGRRRVGDKLLTSFDVYTFDVAAKLLSAVTIQFVRQTLIFSPTKHCSMSGRQTCILTYFKLTEFTFFFSLSYDHISKQNCAVDLWGWVAPKSQTSALIVYPVPNKQSLVKIFLRIPVSMVLITILYPLYLGLW
jgi:hypothetical protein